MNITKNRGACEPICYVQCWIAIFPLLSQREAGVDMELLEKIVTSVNGVLWGNDKIIAGLLLILLCGTGIFYTIRLKFVQIRKFPESWKKTFGSISLSGEKAGKDGMSSFQSLTTAIAAQVGTGNLAGAATAIAVGGPGAIFWMWLSAFFGMATIYAEATLAQKYKVVNENGEVNGGPVYYIKAAYKGTFGKVLAAVFAVFIILALGFMGNMVQANSIGDAFNGAFGINPLYIGIVVAVLAGFIFLGGVGRIASVTEKLVPIMAACYIVGCVIILVMNFKNLPNSFVQIFTMAFKPSSIFGGAVGTTIQLAMSKGVARGLFSNEAGMGSTPHAHALAKVNHPCDQGSVAMMGVFIDTFVILTLTALVIISSGSLDGAPLEGIKLTQNAFSAAFGSFGNIFIAITMFFFAFSTIVGWYFFGECNIKYLFKNPIAVKIYAVCVLVLIVVGSMMKVSLVWDMSDMFNGLMVLPNCLGLLALSGVVVKLMNEHDEIKSVASKNVK